jgi:Ferritin-like
MRSKIRRHLGLLFEETAAVEASPRAALFATSKTAARGQKKPIVPVEFTPHRYAIFLLHIAAEIEHALMVEYLYAAFSLGGPKVPPDRWIEVSQWREIILGIAKEEMGHLMTVQNLLRCLGGPLNLDREDFPWDSEFSPFPFKLEPLTRQSLAKYVYAESPPEWSGAEADEIRALAEQGVGGAAPINHVGSLYKTIENLLCAKDALTGEYLVKDADFRGSTFPFQANWDEWGRGYKRGDRGNSTKAAMAGTPDVLLLPVTARTDALAALQAIATQGEANPEADPDAPSHFARFLRIFHKFPKDQSWSPSRKVPIDPLAVSGSQDDNSAEDWGGTPITHPESKLWAHLFNVRYEALLKNLLHTFEYPNNVSDVSPTTPRGLLLHATFGEMYNVRALSEILVQMPLAADDSELMAGPPFQIPYTLKLPVDAVDRWRSHLDLLQTSIGLADILLKSKGQRHGPYLRAMREADLQLITMIETILNRHPAARSAVKQYS